MVALLGGKGYDPLLKPNKATSERARIQFEAELQGRLGLQSDQWGLAAALDTFASGARKHLATLRLAQDNRTYS